jgi:hypothetical protein
MYTFWGFNRIEALFDIIDDRAVVFGSTFVKLNGSLDGFTPFTIRYAEYNTFTDIGVAAKNCFYI